MPSDTKFGFLFSTIFSLAFFYFQHKNSAPISFLFGFLALLFLCITLVNPSWFRPLNRYWFALSLSLGKIVSPIVLSIIFYGLIVPVALITRLLGRDVLLLKRPKVTSYWVEKEAIDSNTFKNQY